MTPRIEAIIPLERFQRLIGCYDELPEITNDILVALQADYQITYLSLSLSGVKIHGGPYNNVSFTACCDGSWVGGDLMSSPQAALEKLVTKLRRRDATVQELRARAQALLDEADKLDGKS